MNVKSYIWKNCVIFASILFALQESEANRTRACSPVNTLKESDHQDEGRERSPSAGNKSSSRQDCYAEECKRQGCTCVLQVMVLITAFNGLNLFMFCARAQC
jgi:hypothetical protein